MYSNLSVGLKVSHDSSSRLNMKWQRSPMLFCFVKGSRMLFVQKNIIILNQNLVDNLSLSRVFPNLKILSSKGSKQDKKIIEFDPGLYIYHKAYRYQTITKKKNMGPKTSHKVALLLSLLLLTLTLSSQVRVIEATSRKLGKHLYILIAQNHQDPMIKHMVVFLFERK